MYNVRMYIPFYAVKETFKTLKCTIPIPSYSSHCFVRYIHTCVCTFFNKSNFTFTSTFLKYTIGIILILQKTLFCSNGTEHVRPKVTAALESPQILRLEHIDIKRLFKSFMPRTKSTYD